MRPYKSPHGPVRYNRAERSATDRLICGSIRQPVILLDPFIDFQEADATSFFVGENGVSLRKVSQVFWVDNGLRLPGVNRKLIQFLFTPERIGNVRSDLDGREKRELYFGRH